MKKLILMSLVSIALFGCEEKKVTEEMLIGDWECDFAQQVAKWKDGAFQEYGEIERDKGPIKYFMKDNVLYFNFGLPTSYPFKLNSYYDQSEIINQLDNHKIKSKKSITYISPDKYKVIDVMEDIYTNDSDSSENNKTKTEYVCERVKL
ncbi:hypothetical protein A9G07_03840 [Gilliamella sp. wkB72]|uniref:hypothetical protein n=1 Tax=Gilliamella sp. wkB72 TaxID=3120265 RepID=UPI0008106495|nr:hypothetical protein [Gilliamella apicola]OCL23981.1 hypothetical protein A9G07_03840 [Gilliamella apicola]